MGWLLRGLGQAQSDIGAGYDINQQWKQRAQTMAMEQARQKLEELRGPLELQQLRQQIAAFGRPQAAGIERSATGEISGVTFDPKTGTYSVQSLVPGASPEPKFPTLQAAAAYYLQKGDWAKLQQVNAEIERTRAPQKPPEIKDPFELWRAQNPNASVADWLKLQEKYKKSAEGGIKTPFELWIQQHPKGTYDQWLAQSKEEDRGAATKAVTVVLSAQRDLRNLELNIQKTNSKFSVWNPNTWGGDPTLTALLKRTTDDYEQKREDAVAKLTEAGMTVPEYLKPQGTATGGSPTELPGVTAAQ